MCSWINGTNFKTQRGTRDVPKVGLGVRLDLYGGICKGKSSKRVYLNRF